MQKKKRLQISNRIRISSTARTILIVIAIILLALGSGNIIKALTTNNKLLLETKEVYKYTNKFNSESKVNLKSNQYIQEDEITEKQTYLSDLISSIDLNFGYKFEGSEKKDVKYSYKIDAIVSATYTSNNTAYDILNKTETLKKSEEKVENISEFSINENVNVNYSKYHQMIKEFKQTMGINANSHLYIRLTVDATTKVDMQEVKNEYVVDYDITLGDKIALINEKKEEEKSDSVKYEVQTDSKTEINVKNIIFGLVIMATGAILMRFILRKTEKINSIKNEYKLELNRIMRSCESKLVEIEDLKQIDIEHATRVKDITQLLKLSDEALVPIYCYIKEDPEEAYFIVTKYEKSYIYILR